MKLVWSFELKVPIPSMHLRLSDLWPVTHGIPCPSHCDHPNTQKNLLPTLLGRHFEEKCSKDSFQYFCQQGFVCM